MMTIACGVVVGVLALYLLAIVWPILLVLGIGALLWFACGSHVAIVVMVAVGLTIVGVGK